MKRLRVWVWAVPPVAGGLLVMNQGLSCARLFFDRDLSFYYWPEHLWLRGALLSGELPLWDPHVAFGQSSIADPVRQILFLPALPVRCLLPPVIGFNLLVMLPVVLAGLGAFVFFRRRLSTGAASFGATLFALAGPVVSTGSSLNLSWSLAFMPWILWQADRLARSPSPRVVAVWSLLEGLQILAGEPVTAVVTALAALVYVVAMATSERLRRFALALAPLCLGVLLAMVQVLPLFETASRSTRARDELPELLALNPRALAEVVFWPLYGERFPPAGHTNVWLRALNYGHWPLFASVYLGAGTLALAGLAFWAGRREAWCRFWSAAGLIATVLALGRHTPLYPMLQELVPYLDGLRYPAKYFLLATLAVCALAGFGWDEVTARRRRSIGPTIPAAVLAGFGGLAVMLAHATPALALRFAQGVASDMPLSNPDGAARVLVDSAASSGARLFLVGAVVAILLAMSRWRFRSVLLFAVCVVDLLAVNVAINPTLDAKLLEEPPWVAATRTHPTDRVYVGGRLSWWTGLKDIDDVPRQRRELAASRVSESALTAAYQTMFVSFPSGWAVREGVSTDLTFLWPFDYTRLLGHFARRSHEGRIRFLRRTGTRYFLMNRPPSEGARVLVRLAGFPPVALYEEVEPRRRVTVVDAYRVEGDLERHFDLLFSEAFDPAKQVLLFGEPPGPAGKAGVPEPARAVVVEESSNSLDILARVDAAGGYLLVQDSFDPGWVAEVDGTSVPVLRANGLFRAVRLAAGEHRVHFAYRPDSVRLGGIVTLFGVLAVVLLFVSRKRDLRP